MFFEKVYGNHHEIPACLYLTGEGRTLEVVAGEQEAAEW